MSLFRLGRNEERDLAFGRVFLKMNEKFGGSSPAEFLEGFGEFSRHAHRATGADLQKGREGFFEPMGRLEKNGGFISVGGFGEFAGAATAFHRQKSSEEKPVAGKPRADESSRDGGGARQNNDRKVALDAGFDQAVAGIGNARHSGVGDQSDMGASGNAVGQFSAAGGLIVPVQAYEWLFNTEMLEEQTAVARVLGGDKISGFQRLHGTESDVLAVADGCWNDAQHGERDVVYQPSVRRVVRFSAKSTAALERP